MTSLLLLLLLAISAQHAPTPDLRARVDAFVTAFNSGNAGEFEAMVQSHFAGALAARPPEQRRQMYQQLRAELGTIAVSRILRRQPDSVTLHVKGSTGVEARFEMGLEPSAPFRFTTLGIDVGGGGDEPAGVPPPPIVPTMTAEALSEALDAYLSKLAADGVFSGVALVAKDGKRLFEKAYGYADRANQAPNSTATRFNIGSINKIFTHTAVEQLVSRGKLSMSDTLATLLPEHAQELSRAATVAQLLNHTAGIADFFGPEFSRTSKERFRSNADYYRFVSSLPPLFAPGARNQYCNGCYITLGAIIERVSGMPYEKYIEEHIYKPAGMATAGALQTDAIQPNVAYGYTRRGGDGQLRSNIFMHGASGSAAGGGYATAADLLAFDLAMRAGRLVEKPTDKPYRGVGIAGGAPGTSAVLHSTGSWTVVVLTNLDPPTGEQIGSAIARRLGGNGAPE